jgi:integrase
MTVITFAEAGAQMLAKLRASNNPPKENTLRKIASGLRTLNKSIGALALSEVKNGVAKRYVAERVAAKASGSTIDGEFYILRKVVASQVTDEGEYVFPVKWNTEFIDLPDTKPSKDRTKIVEPRQIQDAIAANLEPYSQLCAFLGFTGMRVGEAVACRIGVSDPKVTHWDADAAMVHVRTAIDMGPEHAAKTLNSAKRIVDLSQAANDYLIQFTRGRSGGFLFSEDEDHLNRSRLYKAAQKLELPGGYHSLRRARITWLYKMAKAPAHEQLIKFWCGHENHEGTQTEEYSKLWQDDAFRREFAELAGIGFTLPQVAAPPTEPLHEMVSA